MPNKKILTLMLGGLLALGACGGAKNDDQAPVDKTADVSTTHQFVEEEDAAKAFLKIQYLHEQSQNEFNAYIEKISNQRDLKNNPRKLAQIEKSYAKKEAEITAALFQKIEALNVKNPDIKAYLELQKQGLQASKELNDHLQKLNKVAKTKKRRPEEKDLQHLQELSHQVQKIELDLLQKQIDMNDKFAKEIPEGQLKEFYQITHIQDLAYQKQIELAKNPPKPQNDGESQEKKGKELLKSIIAVDREITQKLGEIKLEDAEVAKLRDLAIDMANKKIATAELVSSIPVGQRPSKKVATRLQMAAKAAGDATNAFMEQRYQLLHRIGQ